MISILQVTPVYYPEFQFGGPPRKIHSLSRLLVEQGFAVSVATMLSTNRAESGCREMDRVQVNYLPWIGYGLRQFPTAVSRLRTLVERADIVHGYGLYNSVCPLAAWMARRAGKPFVIEPQGTYVPRGRKVWAKNAYHALFTSSMLRDAARIVATSDTEFSELLPAADSTRVVLRKNGIEPITMPRDQARIRLRETLKLPAQARVILFAGRLAPIKNLEQMIEAFADHARPDTWLVLVGPPEPDYENKLKTLVAQRGIGGQVVFVGPLFGDKLHTAMAGADLFVLPSLMESFGNAAAEAVTAGTPVLVTKTCGIASSVDQRAGLAVECTRAGLAEGLVRMLYDEESRNRLSGDLQAVGAELSWEKPVAAMREIYKDILSRQPRRATIT